MSENSYSLQHRQQKQIAPKAFKRPDHKWAFLLQLLRREEQLSQREKELKLRGEELNTARLTLTQTQDKLYELGEEHEEMCRINSQLQAQRCVRKYRRT